MNPESPPVTHGRVAVVTGAGSGIGRAIALALGDRGAYAPVLLLGRRPDPLVEVAALLEVRGGRGVACPVDLADADATRRIAAWIAAACPAIALLVHAAGSFPFAPDHTSELCGLVDGAEALTRALLPALRAGRGQLVFVNSSQGWPASTASGPYAESKQALRALADRLRAELNPEGLRVLSLYPGRTATPLQAAIHRHEGRPYRPERLLQPEHIATLLRQLLALPPEAEVTDLAIRPTQKP